MAVGDGITWDEAVPTDSTLAVKIDDHNRDVRKGTRLRMANEHEWPSSQTAAAEAGQHKFITLQQQGTKPTVSGTQEGAVYLSTDDTLVMESSDGTETIIVKSGGGLNVTPTPAAAVVKAWVTFDGTGSTGAKALDDSYNVTGVSKTSTGIYVITWDTDFADTNYCVVSNADTVAGQVAITTRTTGTCTIKLTGDGGPVADGVITLMAIGTQ